MRLPTAIASLFRHRLTVWLLMLEVAVACAVLCNAVFMIMQRTENTRLPSGLAENEIALVRFTHLDNTADRAASYREDVAALQRIAGVRAAAAVGALPLSGDNWTFGIAVAPDGPVVTQPAAYFGSPGALDALGLRLVEGQDFAVTDYHPLQIGQDFKGLAQAPAAIVTRALAERLFPDRPALGQLIYLSVGTPHPLRIVGIVARMLRPIAAPAGERELSMLLPVVPDLATVTYAMRTSPQDRARVLAQAVDTLYGLRDLRLLDAAQSYPQLRASYLRRETDLAGLLSLACAALLVVTALGIFGLASFWIQQRRRQIGVRRALGATRADILLHVQAENLLIVSAGVALGWALAYAVNQLLMHYYEVARLPPGYLLAGGGALWLTGQLAVLRPALGASMVPPITAIRAS